MTRACTALLGLRLVSNDCTVSFRTDAAVSASCCARAGSASLPVMVRIRVSDRVVALSFFWIAATVIVQPSRCRTCSAAVREVAMSA